MSAGAATLPVESTARDYFTLLKPGVMALVVFTGASGMWLAPGHLHPFLQILTVLAIALGSGGGAAINMWYDRDIDARMKRTLNRPIPAGRVAADDALVLGVLLSIAGVALLGLGVNWVAASWLAFAIAFYAVFYTMVLKRSTPQNIVLGGAAGAFPAVIGWAAVSPEPALMPWILFAIVFLWTPPHFWALALYRHDDYRIAQVPMLPVVAGQQSTRRHIFGYTLLMLAATAAPLWAGADWIYGVGATLLGAPFLYRAWIVLTRDDAKRAMGLFGYSILYLFGIFGFLLADHALARALPFPFFA
jgi:protoheme IX farnesyltransferase